MDAQRAAHLRALVEAALQADAASEAADAAAIAARKESERCRDRRNDAAIALQNALGSSQLVYGNTVIYIATGGGPQRVVQVPLERLPAIDPPAPPAPPPPPAEVAATVTATPAPPAAKAAPAPLSAGTVPLGKKK